MIGLLMAAGKLLFVDLHGVDTVWRIAVFVVLGAALLVLSTLQRDEPMAVS